MKPTTIAACSAFWCAVVILALTRDRNGTGDDRPPQRSASNPLAENPSPAIDAVRTPVSQTHTLHLHVLRHDQRVAEGRVYWVTSPQPLRTAWLIAPELGYGRPLGTACRAGPATSDPCDDRVAD